MRRNCAECGDAAGSQPTANAQQVHLCNCRELELPRAGCSACSRFWAAARQYLWLANPLARRGYIVALPHNVGVLPSSVNLAADQAFVLSWVLEQSAHNRSSWLYGRAVNATVFLGHSLIGGTSYGLATDPHIVGSRTRLPSAVATVSMGVHTLPSAYRSAARVSVPLLLLTATRDCIDPAAHNSDVVFARRRTRALPPCCPSSSAPTVSLRVRMWVARPPSGCVPPCRSALSRRWRCPV